MPNSMDMHLLIWLLLLLLAWLINHSRSHKKLEAVGILFLLGLVFSPSIEAVLR